MDERVDAKVDAAKADLQSDMHSLCADIAADFVAMNARIDAVGRDTSDQIVGLRGAVVEYQSTVPATER